MSYPILMSILEHENYRTYLKTVMAEKTKRNPRFSLRAMAKIVGVTPSYLSTVLKGSKNLSYEMATQFARKLSLEGDEADYFCLLVQKESVRDPELKAALADRVRRTNPAYSDLSVEHFRTIADPIHFTLLCVTQLTEFQASSRNLALALGRPQVEVDLALERLEKLDMIEEFKPGLFRKTKSNPRVASQAPNQALRQFHRATLSQAIESLETQSPQEKIIGSETFAIGDDQIEDFRKLADEFFDRAVALAKKAKRRNRVYHLGLQFFNLTPQLQQKRKSK